MKLAIIGSRCLMINDIQKYIPNRVTEIVKGGAKGVDYCAKKFALSRKIKVTEFLPDYKRYGRFAPLQRNLKIIDYSDEVLAFWNGKSRGTKFVIENCEKSGKKLTVIIQNRDDNKNNNANWSAAIHTFTFLAT